MKELWRPVPHTKPKIYQFLYKRKVTYFSTGFLHNEAGILFQKHDVFHMLTGYGTQVEDEIALQYLCLGNGKRSLYLIGAITLGTLILPEYIHYYYQSYQKGRRANPFYHYDYQNLLQINFREFQRNVFCSHEHEDVRAENIINARPL